MMPRPPETTELNSARPAGALAALARLNPWRTLLFIVAAGGVLYGSWHLPDYLAQLIRAHALPAATGAKAAELDTTWMGRAAKFMSLFWDRLTEQLLTVIPWLLMASYVHQIYKKGLGETWRFARATYFGNGWVPYLLAPVIIVFVLGLGYGLFLITPPFLHYGWPHLLSARADTASIVFPKLTGSSIGVRLVAAGLLALMLLLVPELATAEERIFRRNVTAPAKVITRSLVFGFAHLIMGIPLFVALVLSVAGLCYAGYYLLVWRLKDEETAFKRVCGLHAVYNALLFTFVYVTVIVYGGF